MRSLAGILVGGRGRRMGGVAKGLLIAPSGETLVERWQRLFGELGLATVLVGRHEAYARIGMECIDDEPAGIGPLGGLISLLSRARGGSAVAVACDMPYVSRALLEKLVFSPSEAAAVAPRRDLRWEPLFARYEADRALHRATECAAAGNHSLQGLLDELHADPLLLGEDDFLELRDWDELQDRLPQARVC